MIGLLSGGLSAAAGPIAELATSVVGGPAADLAKSVAGGPIAELAGGLMSPLNKSDDASKDLPASDSLEKLAGTKGESQIEY